uniref:Uncharacterized protein n=1 Tax=Parascaris univalens TaxID=6257 RepID=A0A915C506_PARUN
MVSTTGADARMANVTTSQGGEEADPGVAHIEEHYETKKLRDCIEKPRIVLAWLEKQLGKQEMRRNKVLWKKQVNLRADCVCGVEQHFHYLRKSVPEDVKGSASECASGERSV